MSQSIESTETRAGEVGEPIPVDSIRALSRQVGREVELPGWVDHKR